MYPKSQFFLPWIDVYRKREQNVLAVARSVACRTNNFNWWQNNDFTVTSLEIVYNLNMIYYETPFKPKNDDKTCLIIYKSI